MSGRAVGSCRHPPPSPHPPSLCLDPDPDPDAPTHLHLVCLCVWAHAQLVPARSHHLVPLRPSVGWRGRKNPAAPTATPHGCSPPAPACALVIHPCLAPFLSFAWWQLRLTTRRDFPGASLLAVNVFAEASSVSLLPRAARAYTNCNPPPFSDIVWGPLPPIESAYTQCRQVVLDAGRAYAIQVRGTSATPPPAPRALTPPSRAGRCGRAAPLVHAAFS